MKKYALFLAFVLFAAGCAKVASSPNGAAVIPDVHVGPPPAATTTPAGVSTATPLTLVSYQNKANHFQLIYSNEFVVYTAASLKYNYLVDIHASACGSTAPIICFVLNNQPYQKTNLNSAALSVRMLPNKKIISQCAVFSKEELAGGKMMDPQKINGNIFVTATITDAGASNYSETHMHRTFYGNNCYEIDTAVHWANASVFSPPRQGFDFVQVWGNLDMLINTFRFIN
jgi:hypothetical protein